MKIFKRITSNHNFWPVVIVILFGFLAAKGLIGSGYFNMHDDLQMMRQLEMEKCFLSLQIPCRWVPDMGYGFGFPLFNFYPPLPYLFGEIFRVFGIAFTETVKITFIFAFVASGVSMYYLAKEFWGKWGGVLSAIFYIWAPYHSVDIYVRGAMNEVWGIIFFPSILLASYRLIQERKDKTKWIILLALSWVGLLLSHNLMAMIFVPVFAGWTLIWIFKTKDLRKIFDLAIAGVLAFGLAAFFTLPVFLEQGLVQTDSLVKGYFEYSTHFATIRQLLISRFWGYGPSIWGANDGMSFQVGWLVWIVPSIITFVIIVKTIKQIRKNKKLQIENWMVIVGYFFVVGWFAIFMMHNKSTPVWLHISTLRFVQFPWRFLTLVILSFSFIAGAIVKVVPKKLVSYVGGFLVIAVLLYGWDYFLPQHGKLGPLTDTQKFTGAAWDLQRTAGIYDYLPVTAITAPKAPQKYLAEVGRGDAMITNPYQSTSWGKFDVNVPKDTAQIRIGIFKFPNWKTFVDGKEVPNYIEKDEQWGRMWIDMPHGQHHVEVRLYDTPIRTIGNVISLVSWIGLGGFVLIKRRVIFKA